MKQILQSVKNGDTFLEELPAPNVSKNNILIKTVKSLVSLGTEKTLVEFGKSSLLSKARSQPEKVIQVLDKIKTEGLLPTLENVYTKLSEPIPLGYCNVGKVIDVGSNVSEFSIGDRVVSNGAHAEIVNVPKNLAAKIPSSVSDDDAVFTVISSIGMQGIRLINPKIGETVVVYGLGLIGLLSCQILKANGCKVIGIDLDEDKCRIAEKYGVITINPVNNDSVKSVLDITRNIGSDSVLITASSKSNELISQAAKMSRKRGSIVLIGVVGLDINRSDFYEKELSFQVSCSYGPGRYDDQYENQGIDYPLPYVRWTEQRNFESVLHLIKNGDIKVDQLISQKVDFEDFNKIYDDISSKKLIGSILKYSNVETSFSDTIYYNNSINKNNPNVGIIGAGNFTKTTLLPRLKRTGVNIKSIASINGLSGSILAKKFKINESTTNYKKLINDKEINTIFITTRHDSHANLVIESLKAGKNVFVEKPLALNIDDLEKIKRNVKQNPSLMLIVGFNRRFSPHIKNIKSSLKNNTSPVNIIANMNAGFIDRSHWTQDIKIGGGRIIGEACHLIDLCIYLCGSLVDKVCANGLGDDFSLSNDNMSIILKFKNGSNAVINYFSNGSKKYSKERVEIYSQDKTWIVDNFQSTKAYGVKNFKNIKTKLDKGHENLYQEVVNKIKIGGNPLINIDELFNTTEATFAAIDSFKNNKWIKIQNNK